MRFVILIIITITIQLDASTHQETLLNMAKPLPQITSKPSLSNISSKLMLCKDLERHFIQLRGILMPRSWTVCSHFDNTLFEQWTTHKLQYI